MCINLEKADLVWEGQVTPSRHQGARPSLDFRGPGAAGVTVGVNNIGGYFEAPRVNG